MKGISKSSTLKLGNKSQEMLSYLTSDANWVKYLNKIGASDGWFFLIM